jgi:hypothetical protein
MNHHGILMFFHLFFLVLIMNTNTRNIDAYSISTISSSSIFQRPLLYSQPSPQQQQQHQRYYWWNHRRLSEQYGFLKATTTPTLMDTGMEVSATNEYDRTISKNKNITKSTSTLTRNVVTIRNELLELLSTINHSSASAEDHELRQLEHCINTLEGMYTPWQTVSFLHLMMNGTCSSYSVVIGYQGIIIA